MFDAKKLLSQLFDTGDAPPAKGRLGTRPDAKQRLGSDPYASLRAIAQVSAESLGPLPQHRVAGDATAWAAESPEQAHAILLLRAMIAAAKADGAVDPEERTQIANRLKAAGAEVEAQRFVEEELAKPVDLYAITSEVRDARTAAEVYAASLAAIHVDTEAERRYLDSLALRLGLERATVDEINRRFASTKTG
jgi:uncharacterized membrane protein YebE (DUF533 family)